MFDGLKKKFSSFIDSLSRKEQQNAPKEEVVQPSAVAEGKPHGGDKISGFLEPDTTAQHKQASSDKHEADTRRRVSEAAQEHRQPEHRHEKAETEAQRHESAHMMQEPHAHKPNEEPKAPDPAVPSPAADKLRGMRPSEQGRTQPQYEAKPRKEPGVSAATRIKGLIFGRVRISEKDADPFIEELKIGMLQSDVNYDVAERLSESIRSSLVGKEVNSREIGMEIRSTMRSSIMGILTKRSAVDIVGMIRQSGQNGELPFRILFLGPNGAGKTTTMAKIARMLLDSNITCVMSASDTFRAAAIEQTVHHAGKLGINVVKGTYGADPASVAFDAISHAKAHGIMAVLIDSAGRQETNRSLVEELKKIVRVSKPNMKIFIGESISGNALLDQVKAINEAVGLDGIILTKLDVDAKGGNTLSILSDTTVPILFFGTGEKYTDLMPYDPQFVVDSMLPNN
jgi:fused signal recognition particle receptor